MPAPDLRGQPAAEALTALSPVFGYHWKSAPIAQVCSDYWWQDDFDEPPATPVAAWLKALDQRGYLTLSEVANYGGFTSAQQRRVVFREPSFENTANGWARFYTGLTEPERKLALGPAGLPLGGMPPAVRSRILSIGAGGGYGMLGRTDFENVVLREDALFFVSEELQSGTPEQRPRSQVTFRVRRIAPVKRVPGEAPLGPSGYAASVSLPFRTSSKR
jgi:hypothetical protein